jgi:hypothetical protein
MNEKKKSSSSEDDTLMMTDDLVGRLDPESLKKASEPFAKLVPGALPILGTQTEAEVRARDELLKQFYDHTPEPPRGIPTSVSFDVGADDKVEFDGTLQLISFGEEGWRVNVDNVDPKSCIMLAKAAARGPAWIGSASIHGIVRLYKGIDVTVHFGNLDESCTVSIAADAGDPI